MATSDIELQAAYIAAPHTGEVIVKAISTTSISVDLATEYATIDAANTPATKLATALQAGRYISIVSDGADIYYKLNTAAGTADRTQVTGANRTYYAPAGVEKSFVLRKGYTFLDVQGSGAGYVRIYISSVHPHDTNQ